jgi:hypothetical protein
LFLRDLFSGVSKASLRLKATIIVTMASAKSCEGAVLGLLAMSFRCWFPPYFGINGLF